VVHQFFQELDECRLEALEFHVGHPPREWSPRRLVCLVSCAAENNIIAAGVDLATVLA
jgi:hypothetical protein